MLNISFVRIPVDSTHVRFIRISYPLQKRAGMKRNRVRVEKILDTVHRSLVLGCVGLTVYGFYLAGLRFHRYYTVLKPAGDERRRLKEIELLSEGQDKSEFLLPEPPHLAKDKF